jgi:hypothetical protein
MVGAHSVVIFKVHCRINVCSNAIEGKIVPVLNMPYAMKTYEAVEV